MEVTETFILSAKTITIMCAFKHLASLSPNSKALITKLVVCLGDATANIFEMLVLNRAMTNSKYVLK